MGVEYDADKELRTCVKFALYFVMYRTAVDKMYGLQTRREHDPARCLCLGIQLFLVYVRIQ